MKVRLLATVIANGNTDVAIPNDTPETRGRRAALWLCPNTAFDGTIDFLDADADGSTYVSQLAAVPDLTGGNTQIHQVTVPALSRVTGASISAGACRVYLVTDEA